MARKKLDIYDRIAADMERIRNAQGVGRFTVTLELDEGVQMLLAKRTAEASRAFGTTITLEQACLAAIVRGVRMRRL